MSKNGHNPGPVPTGNRPLTGTSFEEPEPDDAGKTAAPHSPTGREEDSKRRMGEFTGTADHARQQPGPRNDGGKRHGEGAG
ncbi:hypothetical protein FRUB_04306 [Fimbriiglobus ruber]|uniref:Uncharacterized protein n=1 Tax=Fimbriiglobus ruber TaxID=1908690 RepID=A0A225DUL6_9BACT|nr:hypothetical protein FRUB_04306 [Fimbriiglobus ruber]